MFRCNVCNKLSAPRTQQNKLVVATRDKVYFEKTTATDDEGNVTTVQGKEIGVGFETVKEIVACNNCAKVSS